MRPEDLKTQKTGQDWARSDEDVKALVLNASTVFSAVLGVGHTATILHGSLATGAFHRPKSDIDLLIVSDRSLNDADRSKIWDALLRLSDDRPLLGDIELSVLRKDVAAEPRHPVPFELHFGENMKNAIRTGTLKHPEQACDEDLAAHLTVARYRGISVSGPSPTEILGVVPWKNYLASIQADFDWIVDGENLTTSPFYGILNICRVLWVRQAGVGCVPDKEEGALWALQMLPERHHALIRQALRVYRSDDPPSKRGAEIRRLGGAAWDKGALLSFRDFARDQGRSKLR